MANSELLYWFPGWAVALGFLAGLVVAVELGFRAGRRHYSRRDKGDRPDLGTIQGAVLGLLGLLLAFAYSFAAARADTRKVAALEEANAIGTAYLRVPLLSEPTRGELRACCATTSTHAWWTRTSIRTRNRCNKRWRTVNRCKPGSGRCFRDIWKGAPPRRSTRSWCSRSMK